MRAFTIDQSIDEVSRATAAWALSSECRRQGLQALTALRASGSESVRCWIDVALADRGLRSGPAHPGDYTRLAPADLDRLSREAAALAEMTPRNGYRIAARVAALARADGE
jgi:hypothetical protein